MEVPHERGGDVSDTGSDITGDSDSDMMSSPSESSSLASTVSSPEASPPGSPARPAAPRVPALRFSLGSLPQAAADSPRVTSSRARAAATPSPLAPPPRPPATPALAVELLSPAFPVPHMDGAEPRQLHAHCAGRLGVAAERIRLYALVEVPSLHELPRGCDRVAVEVAGSSFSLQALEQVLAENHALSAGGGGGQKELHAALAAAQKEADSLRRQLEYSEVLRQQGQSLLHELKQEFEVLHTELTAQATSVPLPPGDALPDVMGTPKRRVDRAC